MLKNQGVNGLFAMSFVNSLKIAILSSEENGSGGEARVTSDYGPAISMFVNEQRTFIDQNTHTWVCLHRTGGTPNLDSLAHFFATDPNEASSHYGVDLDGRIGQFCLEKDGAAANCCLEAGH